MPSSTSKKQSPRGAVKGAKGKASVGKSAPAKKKAPARRSATRAKPKPTAAKPKPSGRKKVARSAASAAEARAARAARRKMLKRFRGLLLDRQRGLVQAYHHAKGATRSDENDGTEDYIDYAVSSYHRDFTLSLTEMERTQLMLVDEALHRIGRDEYGRCLNCGQTIPEKRLEVEPWARYCVRCQELDEQGLLDDRRLDEDEDDERESNDEEFISLDDEAEEDEPDDDDDAGDNDDDL